MYDKPENAQLSRRERVLLDPLVQVTRAMLKRKKQTKKVVSMATTKNQITFIQD